MILYQFCLIFLYSGQNLLGGGPKKNPIQKNKLHTAIFSHNRKNTAEIDDLVLVLYTLEQALLN